MRSVTLLATALLAAPAAAAERLPAALRPELVHSEPSTFVVGERANEPPRQVCVAEFCAPRVAVPGFEQRISMRGRRTELALTYLDRLHLEPFATVAWWLVASGLRVDWAPGQSGDAASAGRGGGHGRFQATLRWRLDALNRPVRPERHGG